MEHAARHYITGQRRDHNTQQALTREIYSCPGCILTRKHLRTLKERHIAITPNNRLSTLYYEQIFPMAALI
jgi:hypothetical protein